MKTGEYYDTSSVKISTSALDELEKALADSALILIRGDQLKIKEIPSFLLKDKYCKNNDLML